MVFRSGAAVFDLAAYPVARLPPGTVTRGFRPEHVTLGASLGPRPGTTVAVVNHSISVLHLAGGTDGVDVLVNIEALQFSDGRLFV